jgi:hypothetical protein
MQNPTSPPEPPCGATLPGRRDCPGTPAATITAEHPRTGHVIRLWRCRDHISATVDTLARTRPDAVITTTLLNTANPSNTSNTSNTSPQPDEPAKPHLRLCQ